MQVFTCQQCEYSSSGSDVWVNAVIIPQNWGTIPFFGASPLRRYCPPILRNDDRIYPYILPRTTVFPQYTAWTRYFGWELHTAHNKWHYGNMGYHVFKWEMKLDKFLVKNQLTQTKWLYFVNRHSNEPTNIDHHFRK